MPFSTGIDDFCDQDEFQKSLTAAFQIAKEQTHLMEQSNAARMNKIANEKQFTPGQAVTIKKENRQNKLDDRREGYFIIIDVRDPVLLIRELYSDKIRLINKNKVFP